MFTTVPSTVLNVAAVAPHLESSAPGAFYEAASYDGSRAATFYVNGGKMNLNPKFAMRTMVAHEVIPGHHLQISAALTNSEIPFFRRTSGQFTAFEEGWALYAERLAQESGFFADDQKHDIHPDYDYLGMLSDELLRATRLVVDTGIHQFDWTREQAVDFMTQHTALSQDEIVTELERYSVLPGQACCYMLGQLELLDLRSFAMEQQGEQFCLPEFHQALFSRGVMSLQQLRRSITAHYTAASVVSEEKLEGLPDKAPVHVVVQEKVDHEREEIRLRQKAEAEKLENDYPQLHNALRLNGLLGQNNDGQGYMNYVAEFVKRGITSAEQLNNVDPHVLVEIGLTPMEQRLYKKVFKMK